jgi:O-6-methylguanine DNA methyltransferase
MILPSKIQEIHLVVIRHDLTTVIIRGFKRQHSVVLTEVIVGSRAQKIASTQMLPSDDTLLAPVIRPLKEYLRGSTIDFSSIHIELENVSEFQKAVLLAARRIPYGKTVSYATLAKMSGNPRAVRAVGSVMRKNPIPLVIPCHRVIRSDGSPGAYAGDKDGADAALKRSLLKLENEGLNK